MNKFLATLVLCLFPLVSVAKIDTVEERQIAYEKAVNEFNSFSEYSSLKLFELDVAIEDNREVGNDKAIEEMKVEILDIFEREKQLEKAYLRKQCMLANTKYRFGELIKQGTIDLCFTQVEVKVTGYNPVEAQTDSSPCTSGFANLCELHEKGVHTIALSQDLIEWVDSDTINPIFYPGEWVTLESTTDPTDTLCNGKFMVADAMNKRWTKKADIFVGDSNVYPDCNAIIRKHKPTKIQ